MLCYMYIQSLLCYEHVCLSVTLMDCDHIALKLEVGNDRIDRCLGCVYTQADSNRNIL